MASENVYVKEEKYIKNAKEYIAIFKEVIGENLPDTCNHTLTVDEIYAIVACIVSILNLHPQICGFSNDENIKLTRFRDLASSIIGRAVKSMEYNGKIILDLNELLNAFDVLGDYGVAPSSIEIFKDCITAELASDTSYKY